MKDTVMSKLFNTLFYVSLATVVSSIPFINNGDAWAITPANKAPEDIQYPQKEAKEAREALLKEKETSEEPAPAAETLVPTVLQTEGVAETKTPGQEGTIPPAVTPVTPEPAPSTPPVAPVAPPPDPGAEHITITAPGTLPSVLPLAKTPEPVPAAAPNTNMTVEPKQETPVQAMPIDTPAPVPEAPAEVHKVTRIGNAPVGMAEKDDVDYLPILEKAVLERPLPTPRKLPFKDAEGKDVILKQFKGKVVLLNFWATWCTPCALEMPHLDAIQEEFDDQDIPIKVVAVSEDFKGVDVIKQFFASNSIDSLDIYMDPKNTLFRTFEIVSLPTTILIDSEGQQVLQISGYVNWTQPGVKEFLRSFVVE